MPHGWPKEVEHTAASSLDSRASSLMPTRCRFEAESSYASQFKQPERAQGPRFAPFFADVRPFRNDFKMILYDFIWHMIL